MTTGNQQQDIHQLAVLFRRLVAAREDEAVRSILAAYARLYESLRTDLDALLAEVAAIRATGAEITMRQAAQLNRLQGLVASVEREVAAIAGNAEILIANGQRALVGLGQDHAVQLVLASMGTSAGIQLTLNRIPTDVTETMIGFLQPGTPLGDALGRLPDMAGETVETALVRSVATGQHPRVVARNFRQAIGGNAASAERLARTAQFQAYRNAVQETYRQNDSVVQMWEWSAGLDSRTCMSCVAQHGKRFPLTEQLVDHWNGRCVALPVTLSWAEVLNDPSIDIPDVPPAESGIEWFTRQPEATQRQMLGRSKYHAWQAGELSLDDLSKVVDDPVWGKMRVEASLKDVLGVDRAREWYRRAAEAERVPA